MAWLKEALRDLWFSFVDFIGRGITRILDNFALWFEVFVGWFTRIFEFIGWAVKSILGFFWSVIDYCLKMAWDFCYYLYDLFLGENGFVWYIFDCALEIGNWFLESLPDISAILGEHQETFGFVMILIGKLNSFFPLTESAVLLGVYLGFVLIFLLTKAVLKLLPSIG